MITVLLVGFLFLIIMTAIAAVIRMIGAALTYKPQQPNDAAYTAAQTHELNRIDYDY